MSTPSIETTKEVRFSVVMYGGVSLAIYINGVAQELFHMARATAPVTTEKGVAAAIPGTDIKSTARVYRKLAYLLANDKELRDYRAFAKKMARLQKRLEDLHENSSERQKLEEELETLRKSDRLEQLTNNGNPISIRFIVDILSGTSAGGINAIYLAKALANNEVIDQLKDLWINEGDIALLLNDKSSVAGTGLINQKQPQSLLNSRRMYSKLLKSLNDMDGSRQIPEDFKSPFVDELDLFITATDIEGVPVPLRLSDAVVFERRHRSVFHFKYGKAEVVGADFNDFRGEFNPFLAFAARCTSSFPFAFEPMRLCDIDEVLDVNGGRQKACKSDSEFWQRFFTEEIDPKLGAPVKPPRFARRSFGDGGYLDNKPFSHATETLIHRQAEVPVDRKLIYVEPSPEHPEDIPASLQKPNALQNVKSALLDLPTYETIREDLQRVLERNQLIERVNRIISGIEKDVNRYLPHAVKTNAKWAAAGLGSGQLPPQPITQMGTGSGTGTSGGSSELWSNRDLSDMVFDYGRYFLPYRRLRIFSVTDDIAKLIARLTNFDENSDQFLAVRCLVRAWREANYVDYRDDPDDKTVNNFLWTYDFGYRLRRINFTRSKVDQITRRDSGLVNEISTYGTSLNEIRAVCDLGKWDSIKDAYPQLNLLEYGNRLVELTAEPSKDFYDVLRFIKCELNEVFKELRTRARVLRSRRPTGTNGTGAVNPLLQHIAKLGITPRDLNQILGVEGSKDLAQTSTGPQDEDDCFKRAKTFFDGRGQTIKQILQETGNELAKELAHAFGFARATCSTLFDVSKQPQPISKTGKALLETNSQLLQSDTANCIRGFLSHYYHNFDDYDQISFPIFYETDVGEADVIEVIRISPEDATSLINEREELRKSPNPAKARKKLAGVALHHFGAFLDRVWRENDIMWGRLDGAERLISALLPGVAHSEVRKELTKEAHLAILKEELKPQSIGAFQSLIAESLLNASTGIPISAAIDKTLGPLKESTQKRQLERVLTLTIEDEELLRFMKTGYEVNRQLDNRLMLKSISRSTQIIGNIFEQLADDNGLDGKRLRWIARLGRLFWGLVEVAVPNSIFNMLATNWLYLIYIFEVLTILGGILLSRPGAQQFGWTAMGITAFLNFVMLLLKDKMRGRNPVRNTAIVLLTGFLGILVLIGALKVVGLFGFTIGNERTPLTWLSQFVYLALSWLGPLQKYLPYLLLLAVVLLVILMLNVAGVRTFGWLSTLLSRSGARRFKPIKLERLTKRDMVNVQRSGPDNRIMLSALARLSSSPSPGWVAQFEQNWQSLDSDNQVRVYGDVLSFTCPEQEVTGVWKDLKSTVIKTNNELKQRIKQEAKDLDRLHKQQRLNQKKLETAKWSSFKDLG